MLPRLRAPKRIADIPAMRSIEFTAHPQARMADRGVSRQPVEVVVMKPLRTLPAAQGRDRFQSLIQRAGKPMLLRIIVSAARG